MAATHLKNIFITGTDTGVGKTAVTYLLVRSLVKQGYKVAAMKPVASGAQYIEGQWVNDDALALMQASNLDLSYELVNPYCFAAPVAPHIAAQQAKQHIDLDVIKQSFDLLNQLADIVIVEGVGGWYVPLSEQCDCTDLVRTLDLSVLLVVGMRLGCINHALLTAAAIAREKFGFIGWIANILNTDMPHLNLNINAIQSRLHQPLVATIPEVDTLATASLINLFDLKKILG